MKYSHILSLSGCFFLSFIVLIGLLGCHSRDKQKYIETVSGSLEIDSSLVWLSHEHILVDFIGADSIQPDQWNRPEIIEEVLPYLDSLKAHQVAVFVDATPHYLGRDIALLKTLSERTGLHILTNTGFYGARDNQYIPDQNKNMSPEAMAAIWIDEFKNGISGSTVRPGFIKISVDDTLPLKPLHKKLVAAAAVTHKATGLTIASHTGKALALWPQLEILKRSGVTPDAFIWVHAQNETDNNELLKAARTGCWISLDGFGWELDKQIAKLQFAKANNFLNRILISHDAGWYDPQKKVQDIQPYTTLFTEVYPKLKALGFTDKDWNQLISVNPSKAYQIRISTQ